MSGDKISRTALHSQLQLKAKTRLFVSEVLIYKEAKEAIPICFTLLNSEWLDQQTVLIPGAWGF